MLFPPRSKLGDIFHLPADPAQGRNYTIIASQWKDAAETLNGTRAALQYLAIG
jgi:hypothetical protein